MAKKFGKFLLLTAAAVSAAGVYHYLTTKKEGSYFSVKTGPEEEDEDLDFDDFSMEDDLDFESEAAENRVAEIEKIDGSEEHTEKSEAQTDESETEAEAQEAEAEAREAEIEAQEAEADDSEPVSEAREAEADDSEPVSEAREAEIEVQEAEGEAREAEDDDSEPVSEAREAEADDSEPVSVDSEPEADEEVQTENAENDAAAEFQFESEEGRPAEHSAEGKQVDELIRILDQELVEMEAEKARQAVRTEEEFFDEEDNEDAEAAETADEESETEKGSFEGESTFRVQKLGRVLNGLGKVFSSGNDRNENIEEFFDDEDEEDEK